MHVYHYHSVTTTQVVLQLVDLKLQVGLVQRAVHEEVVPAVVQQLREGQGPERQPGGDEQESGADECEEEGGAQGDLVPPKSNA